MKGMLRLTILEAAIAIALLRLISEPLQATAQSALDQQLSLLLAYDPPPSTGSPSRGIDSGVIRYTPPTTNPPSSGGVITIRGACASNLAKPGLRGLVPESDAKDPLGTTLRVAWGQTVSDHPTFWFDVPYSSDDDLTAEFVLQDRDRNDLYRTNVSLPPTPGLISIQVPATQPPLQLQQWYRWTLQVKCKGTDTADKNDVVRGWIQRTTLEPALMQQIKEADTRKKAALYAEHGIWFDALTTLGNALSTKPKDADLLRQDWKTLLKSAGLQEAALRPIAKP